MGNAEVFLAGGVVGGAFVGNIAYKAGYEKREQELRPYIAHLEQQNRVKDEKIAELQAKLESRKIPLLSRAVRVVKARLRGGA